MVISLRRCKCDDKVDMVTRERGAFENVARDPERPVLHIVF
jgi:hypothetical protein